MNINQRTILYKQITYSPPLWLTHYMNRGTENEFFKLPKSRYNLGQLPTPIHPVKYVDFSTDGTSNGRETAISNNNCNLIKKITSTMINIAKKELVSEIS